MQPRRHLQAAEVNLPVDSNPGNEVLSEMKESTKMQLQRFLAALAVAVVTATTAAVFHAAPAHAFGCDIGIGLTEKNGNLIWGKGSMNSDCVGGNEKVELWIQRYQGLGNWSIMKRETVTQPNRDQLIYFDCGGWGTQTWRTAIRWTSSGIVRYTRYSNEVRGTCS